MPTQNPNPTPSDGPAAGRRIARHLIRIAYTIAPIIAALAALLVALNAGATIARLLARLGADPVGQVLGGAATVGVLALLLAVALLGQHTPTRALALIYLVAWLPLTIAQARQKLRWHPAWQLPHWPRSGRPSLRFWAAWRCCRR